MPATAASRSSSRSAASRSSMRRVTRRSIVDGSESTSPVSAAASTRLARNSGLPPERSTSRSRSWFVTRPPEATFASVAALVGRQRHDLDDACAASPRRRHGAADQQADEAGALLDRADDVGHELGRRLVDPLGVVDDDQGGVGERTIDDDRRRLPQAGAAELLGELVDLAGRRDLGAERGGQQRQPAQLVRDETPRRTRAAPRRGPRVRHWRRCRRASPAGCARASRGSSTSTRRRRASPPPVPDAAAGARRAVVTCRRRRRRRAR